MSGRLQNVHLRVNDAATGQPIPVRLCITGEDGQYYPPNGRLPDGGEGWKWDDGGNLKGCPWPAAYIDGQCEIELPAGEPLSIKISKGPEYLPLTLETSIAPGKMALRFSLERLANSRLEGWFSGDIRCHNLSPHAALLQGAAEDLGIINLLAYEIQGGGYSNLVAFSGQEPALQRPGHMVVVNTWNQERSGLGNLALLNCHRIVFPLAFGRDNFQQSTADWSLDDWCHQCHRKKGLVVWTPSSDDGNVGLLEVPMDGESLANLLLGQVDVFEVRRDFHLTKYWYPLLAAGWQVVMAAGTGRAWNGQALGSPRTYVHIPDTQELAYGAWIEGVRAGRSFMTDGPLLFFQVDGTEPGAAPTLVPDQRTVHVRAEVRSHVPFERVEIVFNGEVVAWMPAAQIPGASLLEQDIALPGSGWLAARCVAESRGRGPGEIRAHTNAVHIEFDGRPATPDVTLFPRLLEKLDESSTHLEQHGEFSSEKHREHRLEVFRLARAKLVKRLHFTS